MKGFSPYESYAAEIDGTYDLLPFRFIQLKGKKYVLTNEVGEYLVVERQDIYDFVEGRLSPSSDLYKDLKSKHFLLDKDSSIAIELLALKQRTKSVSISNFTGLHIFVVTLRCDHSCPYCQVSRQNQDTGSFDMSEDTALRALDFVFRSPSKTIKIEFQGGESLLNFELIRFIVLKAEELNLSFKRDLQFVIATNLAFIDAEMLDFCSFHDIYISTSLDGPNDLHNKNRPRPDRDSYQKTIDGIRKVREALGPDKISALMTTTEASLSRVTDIVDEYVRQGFDSIFLRSLSPYGFAIKTKKYHAYDSYEWLNFFKEGLAYIIEVNRSGTFLVEAFSSMLLEKMLTPYGTNYVDMQSPAGIGIGAIVYNYDGDVYASDEGRMLAEMGHPEFRLGSLNDDEYEDVLLSEALLEPLEQSLTESVPMCTDCAFQPYCGSDPVYHFATQGDFVGNKKLSGFCIKSMEVIRHLISLLENDPESRSVLMSWVRYR